jgi:hypothetical protein
MKNSRQHLMISLFVVLAVGPQGFGQGAQTDNMPQSGQLQPAQDNVGSQPDNDVKKLKKGSLERYLKVVSRVKDYSRKMDVRPVKQSTGIATGAMMICGHIIPPPYQIEYTGDALFANGIQVDPSPLVERYNHEHPFKIRPFRPAEEAKNREMVRLLNIAKMKFEEDKSSRREAFNREIIDYLHNQGGVPKAVEIVVAFG